MSDHDGLAVPEVSPGQPVSPPPVPAGWYVQGYQQRWWDGSQWTEHFAPLVAPAQSVVVQQYKTSHVFHLIMSIVTVGLWVPVWIIVAIYNSSQQSKLVWQAQQNQQR